MTVVRDGNRNYMRDYLLTQISEADALKRIDEINADKDNPAERGNADSDRRGDADPDGRRRRPPTGEKRRPRRVREPPGQARAGADDLPGLRHHRSAGDDDPAARQAERQIPTNRRAQDDQQADPVRIDGQKTGEGEQVWYQIENLNNGDTGYVEGV